MSSSYNPYNLKDILINVFSQKCEGDKFGFIMIRKLFSHDPSSFVYYNTYKIHENLKSIGFNIKFGDKFYVPFNLYINMATIGQYITRRDTDGTHYLVCKFENCTTVIKPLGAPKIVAPLTQEPVEPVEPEIKNIVIPIYKPKMTLADVVKKTPEPVKPVEYDLKNELQLIYDNTIKPTIDNTDTVLNTVVEPVVAPVVAPIVEPVVEPVKPDVTIEQLCKEILESSSVDESVDGSVTGSVESQPSVKSVNRTYGKTATLLYENIESKKESTTKYKKIIIPFQSHLLLAITNHLKNNEKVVKVTVDCKDKAFSYLNKSYVFKIDKSNWSCECGSEGMNASSISNHTYSKKHLMYDRQFAK